MARFLAALSRRGRTSIAWENGCDYLTDGCRDAAVPNSRARPFPGPVRGTRVYSAVLVNYNCES